MTVGDLTADIKRMAKRGDSLDGEIPGALRRAARWIEQNYTLEYMKRIFRIRVAGGTDTAELPRYSFKAILDLKLPIAGEDPRSLRKVDFAAFRPSVNMSGLPFSYTQDGSEILLFDLAFSETTTLFGHMARYSEWPTAENESHWLLQNAETVLRAQAMLELAVFNRDDRSYQMFKDIRQDNMVVLQNADYEARFANQDLVFGEQ